MRNFAPHTFAKLLTAAIRVVPPGQNILIYGVPGTEGNAVEVARALIKLTDATIAWPEAPSRAYLQAVGIPVDRVRRLPRTRSLSSVWAFVRAKAIYFTHGMYGNPVPSHRRPIVNVWHGDSFKGGLLFPERTLRGPSATYIVSASRLIGEIKAELAELPSSCLLVLGNPRVAQMFSPAEPGQLQALGIDPERPFVLWMPTFRIAHDGNGGVAFSNTADPEADRALGKAAALIATELDRAGFSLVVKPHMLDATSRTVPGAIVLDDEKLSRQMVPLYGLIGASAGLISDYSSVWIDYLAIDRPIGFLVDDLDDFRKVREVTAPELISQYPGERLDSAQGIARFVQDLQEDGAIGSESRAQFKKAIGYVSSASSGDDLVRATLKLH